MRCLPSVWDKLRRAPVGGLSWGISHFGVRMYVARRGVIEIASGPKLGALVVVVAPRFARLLSATGAPRVTLSARPRVTARVRVARRNNQLFDRADDIQRTCRGGLSSCPPLG